jgi:hypothetical protein
VEGIVGGVVIAFTEEKAVRFEFSRLQSSPRTSPRVPNERFYCPLPSHVSETDLPQIALSEKSQQIAHQQNDPNCAKPYACASACAPPAVAVVSSSPAKKEHQNNNEYDERLRSPSLRVATPGLCDEFDYTVCLNPDEFIEELTV